jgi:hypothetical protein
VVDRATNHLGDSAGAGKGKEKMKQIFGLFGNQQEADVAINALQEAELGTHEIRVINEWNDTLEARFDFLPVSHPTSTLSGAVGPRGRVDTTAELGHEGAEFFKRSVERGGVLVQIELADESYGERVESILDAQDAVAVAVEPS